MVDEVRGELVHGLGRGVGELGGEPGHGIVQVDPGGLDESVGIQGCPDLGGVALVGGGSNGMRTARRIYLVAESGR